MSSLWLVHMKLGCLSAKIIIERWFNPLSPQDAQRGRVPPEQPPRQRGSAAARPRRPQPRQRERGVRGARAIRRRADEVRARAEGLHARPDEQEREGGAGDPLELTRAN